MLSPNTERLVASSGLPLQTATMSLCAVIVRSSVWNLSICCRVTPKVKCSSCVCSVAAGVARRRAVVERAFEAVMASVLDLNGRDVRKATVARSFEYLKIRYFASIP